MRADKRIARLTMRDAGPNRLISKEKTGRVANSPSRNPDPFAQCWRGRAESSRPMSAPLSRYLKDFSAPKLNMTALPPVHVPRAAEPARSDIHYTPKPAPEPKIDIEAERQSAYGRGREHAEAELGARHAAELEALRAAHAAELAVLERRLLDEAALTIHRRYSELGAALATILTAQTAEVLRPVLTDALAERAIVDLAAALRQALGDGEGVTLTVYGPAALFAALTARFPADAPVFRHVETQEIDLTVEFGEAILMTRLSAWADTVGKVLA